ncbi:MAG: glycine rich domain-containing protein, partial [Planctomycetota bacterium]
TTATLNGTVNPNGTNVTSCYFDYGTSTSYGISATVVSLPGGGTSGVAVSANITSLSTGTLYNFRVVALNSGGTANGSNLTFTTATPPTCTTNAATGVAGTTATLNGTVNPNGFNVTSCYFDYGTTTSYGSTANVSSLPGSGSSPISVTATIGGGGGSPVTFNPTSTGQSGTIQTWTVPSNGTYQIEVYGAQGGNTSGGTYTGGLGARMRGDFTLTAGQGLRILVGQQGTGTSFSYSGGGGGSFVTTSTNSPLIIAGGGGGGNAGTATYGLPGQITTNGSNSTRGIAGGTGGNGGAGGNGGGGGGGLSTNGGTGSNCNYNPGLAFVNGGTGAAATVPSNSGEGGFGGGASGDGNCCGGGGAGGGYSGGGGGGTTCGQGVGGGGGSYNGGTNPSNTAGARTGAGLVTITSLATPLTIGTLYNFRVVAINAGGTTNGSNLTFTTLPAQVASPSPSTGATNVPITQQLSWGAVSGVTGYNVYFGTSSPGTLVSSNQSGTTYSPTLTNSTLYYWRIDSVNASGTTTGIVWSFTTAVLAQAGSPSPSTGATNISIIQQLSWGVASGATGYNVYFGTSSPGTLVSSNQSGTTYNPGTLANNTLYYWRIDSVNAAGTTTGIVWSFTTIVAAPAQVGSPTPANSATNIPTNQQLSWGAVSGATGYNVYFGISSPGTLVSSNQSGTTYNPGALAGNTTYYWRIDSVNVGGTTTGIVWSFTTTLAQVNTPTPANVLTNVSITQTLSWGAASGATGYNVYFGTSSPGTLVSSNQSGTTYNPGTLAGNTTYYWRIDPTNTSVTITGIIWSFTTAQAPTCTTNAATNVAGTTATLNGTVNPNGTNVTTCYFDYGTTTSYGISATVASLPGSGTSGVAVTANITSLSIGTLYNFRVVAINTGGTTNGSNLTFNTLSPPTCTTNAATSVAGTTATLNGTVNPNGFNVTTCYFDYGTTTSYGISATVVSLPGSGSSPISVTANSGSGTGTPVTFNYTGGLQTWVVPAGVTSIIVDVQGAQGGTNGSVGGLGGRTQATLAVTPGSTLYIYVGNQPTSTAGGYNGGGTGGPSYGFGGGGASDIRTGTVLANRIAVAGGGGSAVNTWSACNGGAGGSTNGNGADGASSNGTTYIGFGGTQSGGGAVGTNATGATAGSLGQGGNASTNGGGGGGGGYYGGGGSYAGGAGGGSCWSNGTSITYSTDATGGNGQVIITPAVTPLTIGTQYNVRVVAINSGGTTNGNNLTFTTSSPQVGSPTPANSATNIPTNQQLGWGAASGATGYNVYFGTSSPGTLVSSNQSGATYNPGTLTNNTLYYWRIDSVNVGGTTTGNVWSFTIALAQVGSPTPSNGATNIPTNQQLSWGAASGATGYNVYFGTSSPGTLVSSNQSGATYNPGTLTNNTLYYWRIDSVNSNGTTTGAVWSFTAIVAAPDQVASPTPSTGTTNIPLTQQLSWASAARATGYTVYFGTSSPGTLVSTNQSSTTYNPGTLTSNTLYYWRIDSVNVGGTTTGIVWNFTTSNIVAPTVTTQSASSINSQYVTGNGNITSLGGAANCTARGFYYGLTQTDTWTASDSGTFGTGAYTRLITGLTASTLYYYRAFATNSAGTGYGSYVSFTTAAATTTTFNYTGGTQSFTVPANITSITVDVYGAQGGNGQSGAGGYGARMQARFTVTPGWVFDVRVGGAGIQSTSYGGSGGGGSYFVLTTGGTTAYLIAGGGGGGGYNGAGAGVAGTTSTSGTVGGGTGGGAGGTGGTGGNGGTSTYPGAGGGGYSSNGTNGSGSYYGYGGTSYAGGGAGGAGNASYGAAGGFGGGGGCSVCGGGGGGYSGGGGGAQDNPYSVGGGGGSYSNPVGTPLTQTSGARAGAGLITVTY